MKVTKIKPEEIKQGDNLLLKEKNRQSGYLCKANCVDNQKVWTECLVSGEEPGETFEQMKQNYDGVYRVDT